MSLVLYWQMKVSIADLSPPPSLVDAGPSESLLSHTYIQHPFESTVTTTTKTTTHPSFPNAANDNNPSSHPLTNININHHPPTNPPFASTEEVNTPNHHHHQQPEHVSTRGDHPNNPASSESAPPPPPEGARMPQQSAQEENDNMRGNPRKKKKKPAPDSSTPAGQVATPGPAIASGPQSQSHSQSGTTTNPEAPSNPKLNENPSGAGAGGMRKRTNPVASVEGGPKPGKRQKKDPNFTPLVESGSGQPPKQSTSIIPLPKIPAASGPPSQSDTTTTTTTDALPNGRKRKNAAGEGPSDSEPKRQKPNLKDVNSLPSVDSGSGFGPPWRSTSKIPPPEPFRSSTLLQAAGQTHGLSPSTLTNSPPQQEPGGVSDKRAHHKDLPRLNTQVQDHAVTSGTAVVENTSAGGHHPPAVVRPLQINDNPSHQYTQAGNTVNNYIPPNTNPTSRFRPMTPPLGDSNAFVGTGLHDIPTTPISMSPTLTPNLGQKYNDVSPLTTPSRVMKTPVSLSPLFGISSLGNEHGEHGEHEHE